MSKGLTLRLAGSLLLALVIALGGALPVAADFPWPAPPPAVDPYDYHLYLFTEPGQLPSDYDIGGDEWMLSSEQDDPCGPDDPPDCLENELQGVMGASVDRAWEITVGRPDVILAVLDDGIKWHQRQDDLVNKVAINAGELPLPAGSDEYDANGDGIFNVRDYADDPAVYDANGNGQLDPEDLILLLSDGVDADGNGYTDDIAGWDFFQDDNNPRDDTLRGHGTGQAKDSAAEVNNGGSVGVCPNCLFLPVRVGDSFVIETNDFAQGALFAVDSGAAVVRTAVGAVSNTTLAQEAVEYAYRRGVPVVGSAADEEDAHHNYPTYNHVITVNAVNKWHMGQTRESYLYLNGCTNVGPRVLVTVPAESCSSEAVGKMGGILGLAISAARNARARGDLTNYVRDDGSLAPFVLSANEIRQLLLNTADDIDFSGDYQTHQPVMDLIPNGQSRRFISKPGWDRVFGYGRVNARTMIEQVAAAAIPPEADITGPRWFQIVDPQQGSLDVIGRAAANRVTSAGGVFTYTVAAAGGVSPRPQRFVTLFSSEILTAPVEGLLATIDLDQVAALLPDGVTGPLLGKNNRLDPDRFAWTLRLQVADSLGRRGEALISLHLHSDPDLRPGFPRWLGAAGTSSPAFADLDGDLAEELLLATDDGWLHAWRADGQELPGWPVHTDPLPLHLGAAAYQSGEITLPAYGTPLVGAPAVGDLDGAGGLEVALSDMEGQVYAWDAAGNRLPGFPAAVNPAFSQVQRPDGSYLRDPHNAVDWGFIAQPVLADLDDPAAPVAGVTPAPVDLEIIAGSGDRHVYAWRADGAPQPGWPVLLQSPEKVASVEPGSHFIVHADDSGVQPGSRILASPAVGDIDGDGLVEIIASTNEGYAEPANVVIPRQAKNALQRAIEASSGGVGIDDLSAGNGRVYAIHRDGTLHDGDPADDDGLDPDAFLAGWPTRAGILILDQLPLVGTGVNNAATLADVDGDGDAEVGAASFLGPFFVWQGDGVSILGQDGQGRDIPMDSAARDFGQNADTSETMPSFASLGGGIFTDFDPAPGLAVASPAGGVGRLLDLLLNAKQTPSDDLVNAWDASTGDFLPGFPHVVSDMQFLSTPAAADMDGDGLPELLAATSTNDFHALRADGSQPAGWPRLTGGWTISTPAVGDLDGDGLREVALVTRDGWLYVWNTPAGACGPAPWPRYGHDGHNSGNYDNPLVEPWGHLTDLDYDCDVDGRDLQPIFSRWRCAAGDACYNARYDLNDDAIIDLADLILVLGDLGWHKGQ